MAVNDTRDENSDAAESSAEDVAAESVKVKGPSGVRSDFCERRSPHDVGIDAFGRPYCKICYWEINPVRGFRCGCGYHNQCTDAETPEKNKTDQWAEKHNELPGNVATLVRGRRRITIVRKSRIVKKPHATETVRRRLAIVRKSRTTDLFREFGRIYLEELAKLQSGCA